MSPCVTSFLVCCDVIQTFHLCKYLSFFISDILEMSEGNFSEASTAATTNTTINTTVIEELAQENSTDQYTEGQRAQLNSYNQNQAYYIELYSAVFRESLKAIGISLDAVTGTFKLSEETKNNIGLILAIFILVIAVAALQFWNLICTRQARRSQKKHYTNLQHGFGLRQ